jgi:cytoskeletal protein CcmA (bactofilin family)
MFGKNEPRLQNDPSNNGTTQGAARDTASAVPTARVQHSILSGDTKLTGDLVSNGDVTIEGTVEGSVTCRSLTLCGEPAIEGTVTAETAHVSGAFNGELRAKKVILNKTAKMRGDIYQEVLEMHPGAQFEGKVARLPDSRPKSAGKAKTKSATKPTDEFSPTARTGNGKDRTDETDPSELLLT